MARQLSEPRWAGVCVCVSVQELMENDIVQMARRVLGRARESEGGGDGGVGVVLKLLHLALPVER